MHQEQAPDEEQQDYDNPRETAGLAPGGFIFLVVFHPMVMTIHRDLPSGSFRSLGNEVEARQGVVAGRLFR
jgi:hypothetical protein